MSTIALLKALIPTEYINLFNSFDESTCSRLLGCRQPCKETKVGSTLPCASRFVLLYGDRQVRFVDGGMCLGKVTRCCSFPMAREPDSRRQMHIR